MKRYIHNPRILLIGTSLDFNKIKYKYENLLIVKEQEKEYMNIISAKIMTCKPDVILVQGYVNRICVDIFLEVYITYIFFSFFYLNIYRKVLQLFLM